MANYVVQWAIDIEDAENAEDAARQAWAHMRRSDSTANVFSVTAEDGGTTQIDLQELDESTED